MPQSLLRSPPFPPRVWFGLIDYRFRFRLLSADGRTEETSQFRLRSPRRDEIVSEEENR